MICPTLDRPDLALRFSQSFLATTTHARLVVVCEPGQADQYKAIGELDKRVVLMWGRGGSAAQAIIDGAYRSNEKVIGVAPDDCEFHTAGWDDVVLEAAERLPNGIGVINPASPYGMRVEMPLVTRKWIDALGCLVPLTVHHYWWNTCLAMLAEGLGPLGIVQLGWDQMWMTHDEHANSDRLKLAADSVRFSWWAGFEYFGQLTKLRAAVARRD